MGHRVQAGEEAMIYILAVLVLLLTAALYYQYHSRKKTVKNLEYITTKLEQIESEQSSERLLLFTEDKQVRSLLTAINRLLDAHGEFTADTARIKHSMNRMLSNVSHDLKTPLTVIYGYIETIQQDERYTAEERERMLAEVQEKVTEAAALINRFFDLAKLESGDRQVDWEVIHLNELCRQAILGYYETLTSKGFDVSIDIPEGEIYLYGEEAGISRILGNLLSNAIRYGSEGKTIGLALKQDDDVVQIEVWDKGRGIAEKDEGRVFERLYTLDDSRSSSAEGSGLGLTIAKRLTEQMGGSLSFTSIPHERTAFTVSFKKPLPNVRNT